MHCQLVCDCGRTLDLEGSSSKITCPKCQARYAITITKIQRSSKAELND